MSQIQHDIDTWYQFYGASLSGIFFDQTQNACGPTPDSNEWADLYSQLSRRRRTPAPGSQTVLNPGIAVPQCYENAADVIVTFEGSYASYVGDPTAAQPVHAADVDADRSDEDLAHRVRRARCGDDGAGGCTEQDARRRLHLRDRRRAGQPVRHAAAADYWAAELATTAGDAGRQRSRRSAASASTRSRCTAAAWTSIGSARRPHAGAAYDIYRDGILIDSVPGTSTTYSAVDLTPRTSYVFMSSRATLGTDQPGQRSAYRRDRRDVR